MDHSYQLSRPSIESMIPKMYMSRTVLYTENWSGSTAIQTWVHYKNLVLYERKQNYEIQQ